MRVIGPAVSWLGAIGRMPWPLISPTVGLTPTQPWAEAGHRIEPSVSVPTVRVARPSAAAAAEPLDEPHGVIVVS